MSSASARAVLYLVRVSSEIGLADRPHRRPFDVRFVMHTLPRPSCAPSSLECFRHSLCQNLGEGSRYRHVDNIPVVTTVPLNRNISTSLIEQVYLER